MHILIIEDNLKINHLITLYCNQEGYQTTSVFSAEEGLKVLNEKQIDLVITDLMLKNMTGEAFIKKIRENSTVYIIVVSAKTDILERLDVLQLGADDYLTKPFSLEELMIRIKNVSQRIIKSNKNITTFNNQHLIINALNQEIQVLGEKVDLTYAEYQIILTLVKHHNQVLTREQIIELTNLNSEAFDRVIDAHIKNIRKKIKDDSKNPRLIKTIYGGGYKFVGDKDA
jgi:DNA-binding response OmpR family regulator